MNGREAIRIIRRFGGLCKSIQSDDIAPDYS